MRDSEFAVWAEAFASALDPIEEKYREVTSIQDKQSCVSMALTEVLKHLRDIPQIRDYLSPT